LRRLINLEVFQYRSYRLFLSASVLNFVAFNMQNLARSWLMVELTDSPLLITLVTAVTFTPVLILSAFGGVLADNFNRKYVVLTADALWLANVAVMISLTVTGIVTPWMVLTLSATSGVLFALSGASRQTMQSLILPHELFRRGSSTYAVFFNVAVLVSPAITVFTLPVLGVAWTMATAFAIKVASSLVLVFIHLRRVAHERLTLRKVGSNLASGVSYSLSDVNLRALLSLLAAMVITLGSFRAGLPLFAEFVYENGETGYTLLFLFAGVGAVIGAVLIAVAFNKVDYNKHHGYAWGVLGGLSLIGFALSPYFWLGLVFMVLTGASVAAFLAFNVSTITVIAPDELRGRIMSLRGILFGTTPIGALLLGVIAERWSAPVATAAMAIAGLGLLAAIYALEHHGFAVDALRRLRGRGG